DGLIREAWRQIDAELARKEEAKKEALAPIAPGLVEVYEELRGTKEGVAIAAFENGVCGGGHMALSPSEREEAFSEDLPRCVHCRRILVAWMLFWHLGAILWLVRWLFRDPKVDVRFLFLGALLPDLIDIPVGTLLLADR